jgi:hypothetical protein
MATMKPYKFSTQSILSLIVCIGGIIAFLLLVIYPNHRELKRLDLEMNQIETRLGEQKVLTPIFNELRQQTKIDLPNDLPNPEPGKLSRAETSKITFLIREIVQEHQFVVDSIQPDVETLVGGSGHMRLNLSLRGDFINLRQMLLRLFEIPSLEHVEQLEVSAGETPQRMRLKLWFAHL